MSCNCNGINILQSPDIIDIKQCPENININESPSSIYISQESSDIKIIQVVETINVCANNPIFNNFIPFFFTATQDQISFTLPGISLAIWVAINGTSQSQAKSPTPDFTVVGNILTLSDGVDEGDTVFGMMQIM